MGTGNIRSYSKCETTQRDDRVENSESRAGESNVIQTAHTPCRYIKRLAEG